MRPYRGKTYDKKWVYGYYFKIDETHYILSNEQSWLDEFDSFRSAYAVDSETIGQYTRRKDINDIDIYENDILEFEFEGEKFKTDPVGWQKDLSLWKCGIGITSSIPEDICLSECSYEIVGNIHDNPELLKRLGE